jgi:hypothetical protein
MLPCKDNRSVAKLIRNILGLFDWFFLLSCEANELGNWDSNGGTVKRRGVKTCVFSFSFFSFFFFFVALLRYSVVAPLKGVLYCIHLEMVRGFLSFFYIHKLFFFG